MHTRLFAVARAVVVATIFISLWAWFIPRWLAGGDLHPRWTVLPVALMAIGGAIMLRCVWDFAWTGRGTPAPFDPPRRLVVAGLYRRVRNPMYLGMFLFLAGEALLLPDITREMLLVLAGAAVLAHGFVFLYEEPKLRELFGDDYVEYCRNVRRWLPHLVLKR